MTKRIRTGLMILELKRDETPERAFYKCLAEIMDVESLVTAQRQQCEVQVATAAVRLCKGMAGPQVALAQLPVADANKSIRIGMLKVG